MQPHIATPPSTLRHETFPLKLDSLHNQHTSLSFFSFSPTPRFIIQGVAYELTLLSENQEEKQFHIALIPQWRYSTTSQTITENDLPEELLSKIDSILIEAEEHHWTSTGIYIIQPDAAYLPLITRFKPENEDKSPVKVVEQNEHQTPRHDLHSSEYKELKQRLIRKGLLREGD